MIDFKVRSNVKYNFQYDKQTLHFVKQKSHQIMMALSYYI